MPDLPEQREPEMQADLNLVEEHGILVFRSRGEVLTSDMGKELQEDAE